MYGTAKTYGLKREGTRIKRIIKATKLRSEEYERGI
jgi:hypothetical protein